jgi:Ca2+-binding RTX toxin-like protein
VFAAYVDVMYEAARAAVDGPITYGPHYPNGQDGDTSVPGLIDEVGAFDEFTPLGGSPHVLFVIPMTATSAGTINFVLDPADESPAHDVLVFGSNDPVPISQIQFVNASLVVQPAANTVVVVDGVLTITGSDQANTVTVSQVGSQIVVTASFLPGGTASFPAAEITSIDVSVSDGNDTVVLAPSVSKPAQVDGGDGNDTLVGGSAAAILLGGAGNDTITGGAGRNVIIGGLGADTIVAGGGDDLLMSGTTSFDANDTALKAILDEWTSARTYSERVANLRTGSGPVLSGTGVSLQKGVTVFDDVSTDVLVGGADLDWFLYDLTLDIAADKGPTEAAN